MTVRVTLRVPGVGILHVRCPPRGFFLTDPFEIFGSPLAFGGVSPQGCRADPVRLFFSHHPEALVAVEGQQRFDVAPLQPADPAAVPGCLTRVDSVLQRAHIDPGMAGEGAGVGLEDGVCVGLGYLRLLMLVRKENHAVRRGTVALNHLPQRPGRQDETPTVRFFARPLGGNDRG
ncbi:hypothetical protein OG239_03190 [Streptomyces sp. NBC_00868]|uniref:hypothetical protein n=1 Tax=unclassified Streptomyces TaxID=2593676 RepID=UPI003249D02C|nr:hypothetical protein OG239_03190 [Streptomyces sp. NBC_00868]